MLGEQFPDFLVRFSAPGGGDVLLLRVSPEIAVVEVNHYLHSQVAGPAGLDEQVLGAVPVAVLRRINPDPEPHGVQPEVLHQPGAFHLLALFVIEVLAIGL